MRPDISSWQNIELEERSVSMGIDYFYFYSQIKFLNITSISYLEAAPFF